MLTRCVVTRGFKKAESAIRDSPAFWVSIVCCSWVYIRVMLYELEIDSRASLAELTLVALIGAAAALIGLLRDREQAWYLNVVTMVLNSVAWWLGVVQVNWGELFSS
jgi:hypothetical protein